MLFALYYIKCEQDEPTSVYNPDEQFKSDPLITHIYPDSALAGFSVITIHGENFSSNPDENIVFFKDIQNPDAVEEADIISASETELVVLAPEIFGDSIQIKLSVIGALKYAVFPRYKLMPAVESISVRLESDLSDVNLFATGVAVDRLENVYVFLNKTSSVSSGAEIRVLPFSGQFDNFTTSPFLTSGFVIGPGNSLYATANLGRIKYIGIFTPDGSSSIYKTLSKIPRDLDFDSEGNIWIVAGKEVFILKKDMTVTSIDSYPLELYGLRIFENFLFVIGQTGKEDYAEQIIWKSKIQNDNTLNDRVEFINKASVTWIDTSHINAFTLDSEGYMYVATNKMEDCIIVIRPNGEYEGILYPRLINHPVCDLTWGEGTFMYGTQMIRSSEPIKSNLLKINLQKYGAIYWGRKL